MAENEIRRDGTQENREGTDARTAVHMTQEEIVHLVHAEVEKALAREKKSGAFAGSREQMENLEDAVNRIACSVEKSSRSNKVAAIGSILLLAVFGTAFALITPGLFTLLGNLNSTVSGLETTVNEVNSVVASANDTAQKVNGIVGDVSDQINDSFDQVNGVIDNVNDQVSGIGTAIDGLNEAVWNIDAVVTQNTDSINEIMTASIHPSRI